MACPNIQTYILEQTSLANKASNRDRLKILLNIVNYMINQNKSRLCDNIAHAYFKKYSPDVSHTDHLNQFERILNYYKNRNMDANKLLQDSEFDRALRHASYLFKKHKVNELIDLLKNNNKHTRILASKYYKHLKLERNSRVLLLIHLILYSFMKPNKIKTVNVPKLSNEELENIIDNNPQIVFEDYVFDKHTAQGKKKGHGMKHFYEKAAVLVNCNLVDPYEKIAMKNNIK